MNFEEYVEKEWKPKHIIAEMHFRNIGNDLSPLEKESFELDRKCLQKNDWFKYCIEKDDLDQITTTVADDFIKDVTDLSLKHLRNPEKSNETFSTIPGLMLSFYKICDTVSIFNNDQKRAFDDAYLDRMISAFRELFESSIGFSVKLDKVLSWFDYRQYFCQEAQIGFSPEEFYVLHDFFKKCREELIKLRESDFLSWRKLSDYSIWIYLNAKNVPEQFIAEDLPKFKSLAIACCRNTLVAASANGYFESEDGIKDTINILQDNSYYKHSIEPVSDLNTTISDKPTLFISYNWKSKKLVNKIQNRIEELVTVKRDIYDLGYGDDINAFMDSITDQDYVLLVISEGYLHSDACMRELTSLYKRKEDFQDAVLILVCSDASIYTPAGRSKYVRYWQDKYDELTKEREGLRAEWSVELDADIRFTTKVLNDIGEILDWVKTRNNFNEDKAPKKIRKYLTSLISMR